MPLKRMGIHAALCQTYMTQMMMRGNPFHHARRGDIPLFKGAAMLLGEGRGEAPVYFLAGSGACRPRMWQMASVSLARLSV